MTQTPFGKMERKIFTGGGYAYASSHQEIAEWACPPWLKSEIKREIYDRDFLKKGQSKRAQLIFIMLIKKL